ncbi:MAG: stage III sporulation protein AF [Eubacteriaceae bacterium]|nr:stage III sporulation protein AF [Eubacteriaceae bacterium]
MDQITTFVRQILITAIFFSIIIIIVPDEKYKKYIKFFCSAFLAVMLIAPIKSLLDADSFVYNSSVYEVSTKQEYEDIQDKVVQKQYITNLKNEIKDDLAKYDIDISCVEITLKDNMSVNSVTIDAYIAGSANINNLRAQISKKLNVEQSNIKFNNGE